METPIAISVFEHTVTVFVYCTGRFIIIFMGLFEIIFVDKIITSIIRWIYKDVIFDTKQAAGKVYKNSENRRKQGVSCGFRCICRYSIGPIRPCLERG